MNLNDQNLTDSKDNSYNEANHFLDSFIVFIDYILVKRYLILFNFIVSILVSIVILYFTSPEYTSKSSYVSPPPELLMGSYQDFSLSSSPITLSGGIGSFLKDPSEIYLQVLKSQTIRQNIINKYNLTKFFNTLNNEYTLDKLSKKNIVNITNNKGITEISVTTTDKKLSADIANEYVNQLALIINRLNVTAAKTERNFLEKRLKEVDNSLLEMTSKLSKFQVKNKMINVDKQGSALIESIAEIQVKIIEYEAELNGIKTIYTENSPKVKALNEKILILTNELTKIKGKKNNSSNQVLGLGVNLLEMPDLSVTYLELARGVKIQETVFELLSKQYELAKLKEAKEKIVLKVIDVAIPAIMKSAPKIKIIVLVVGLLSIIFTLTYLILKKELEKISALFPETKEKINNLKSRFYEALFFKKTTKN